MKIKRLIKILSASVLVILSLFLLVYLQTLTEVFLEQDPTSQVQVMTKDLYDGNGLTNNLELAENPLEESDGIIRYSDRWLVRFTGSDENTEYAKTVVESIKDQHPSIEEFYVVPIPPRIVMEDGYETELEAYLAYMESFEEIFADTAQTVDVLPALQRNDDAFLFFRTENRWTARGAFYGTETLCDALGIESLPLEAYDEHMYNAFRGEFYDSSNLTLEEAENFPDDPIFYYQLPDSKNREVAVEESGIVLYRPIIAPSEGNLSTFVFGNEQYAIVEGDEMNEDTKDEVVLMICDSNGKLMIPYVANYYKQVYAVNIMQYREFSEELDSILENYDISKIIWAQSAQDMGNKGYSRAVNSFRDEEN